MEDARLDNALTKKNFVTLGERGDRKLGKLRSRTMLTREFKTDLPGAPPGEYVAIQYRCECERWPKVAELVVPMLENDGVWRVSGWHNNPETIPPDEREFALAVRAGRGKLSKEEQQDLAKKDHPLAAQLADPGKKAILDWFASLPEGAHEHLLNSKSIEEFANTDNAASEPAKLQGTFTTKTLGDGANWAMTLDGAGRFRMTRNGQLGVEGSYRVMGDTIEFTDESGPFREQGSARSGTYRWRLTGTKLIFDRLSDEARGRSTILLSNAWDKQ